MPIRFRLTVWYAALLALALCFFAGGVYFILDRQLRDTIDRSLEARTLDFLWTITPGNGSSLQPRDLADLRLDLLSELETPGLFVQVLDAHGKVIGRSPNLERGFLPTDDASLRTAMGGKTSFSTVSIVDKRPVRVLATPIKVGRNVVGVLQVAEPLQPLRETMESTRNTLIVGIIVTLLFAVGGGWFLGSRALAPIAAIAHAARRIRDTGDYSRRVGLPGARDEVRDLAQTFDSLIEQVDQSLRRHREFLADSSHELRSPLTVIRGNIDLLRRPLDEIARHQVLTEMQREADFMRRIVADLLMLAQVEAKQVIDTRPVQLARLAEQVAQRYTQVPDGERVRIGSLAPVTVLGDSDRLQQVLVNLLDNALRHTPANGTVTVRVGTTPNWAYVIIEDTGRGIAPEHLPHVFKRFYRADKSRSRAEGHAGLGLAIVKYVVEAHSGTVSVKSELGKGTAFTISLPVYRPTPVEEPAPVPVAPPRRPRPIELARQLVGQHRPEVSS